MIENLLRNDLILIDEVGFAPLDATGAQLLFRLVAAAYERRALGIGSHWPFDQWGRFLPEHTTAVSLLDRLLHHASVVITDGDSTACARPEHEEEPPLPANDRTREVGTFNWPPVGTATWPLTDRHPGVGSRSGQITADPRKTVITPRLGAAAHGAIEVYAHAG